MKIVLVAALLLPLAAAHLCLLSPAQRGTISGLGTPGKINRYSWMLKLLACTAGSDDCALEKKQCGERLPNGPISTTLW